MFFWNIKCIENLKIIKRIWLIQILFLLVILNNLENINSELIELGISQGERLIKLNSIARKQINILNNNKSFDNLKYIENDKIV